MVFLILAAQYNRWSLPLAVMVPMTTLLTPTELPSVSAADSVTTPFVSRLKTSSAGCPPPTMSASRRPPAKSAESGSVIVPFWPAFMNTGALFSK